MNGRERILALLEGQPIDRLPLMPITMQLAARLIGTSYRKYSTDFRVLVDGQLRVAETFDLDYVNTMSDPAREAADCGAKVAFFEQQPAALIEEEALLGDKTKLSRLKMPDPLSGGRMLNGIQAVALHKQKLGGRKLIEGWIEGPCAEGADLRGLSNLMLDFFDDAPFVRDLFEFVTDMELRFARNQIEAGAEIIGIGDAAASLVGPRIYHEFIWPFEKKLVEGVHALGAKVRLHICGNTRALLEDMGKLGCDIVDLDFLTPVAEARAKMGDSQVLLGNLNPVAVMRNGTPESVTSSLAECHREAGARFIVGAGCELPRDTPAQNFRAMVEYARRGDSATRTASAS